MAFAMTTNAPGIKQVLSSHFGKVFVVLCQPMLGVLLLNQHAVVVETQTNSRHICRSLGPDVVGSGGQFVPNSSIMSKVC
jgi:hypothetical protein